MRNPQPTSRVGLSRKPLIKNSMVLRGALSENATAEIQSSNIRVAVRVRPLNERETATNSQSVVKVASEKLLVFDPNEDKDNFFYHGVKQNNRDFTKKAQKDAHFAFDGVFSPEATNQEVFEGTTKAVVDAVLEGFNCSVFAYGATGAGKTHTMLGNPNNPGIIFLTVMDLYQRMEELRAAKKFEISVSYLEVYNENVRDLLAQSNFLTIRDNGHDGITVTGLSSVKPSGAEALLSLLRYGNSNRTQHPTDHNAESSRSHAVFQVWVKQSDRASGLSTNVKVAKMSLIDLAGSERGCATGLSGERFREGNNINRSLLALGNCINALAEGRRHVPYRDSKLTRLLQDSLGGNCKTVMIAAISPAIATYEDTYKTLKYADRAKNIKSNVKKNERSVQLHVTQYEKMISELRIALAAANEKVRCLEMSRPSTKEVSPPPIHVEEAEKTVASCEKCSKDVEEDSNSSPSLPPALPFPSVKNIREEWSSLLHEKREIQHKMTKLEQLEKDFEYKISLKTTKNDRVEKICLSNLRLEKLRSKLEREVSLQKPKLEVLSNKRKELENRLAVCSNKETEIHKNSEEMMSGVDNEEFKQILQDAMRMKQLETAVQGVKDQNSYLVKCLQSRTDESRHTEDLLLQLMKTTKSLYLTLRTQPSFASYMEEDFNNMVTLVEGGRGVCWADQKEEPKETPTCPLPESVILSPLTESDVRLDVPPSSVLFQSRRPTYCKEEVASIPSALNGTVIIQPADLDATFDASQSSESHTTKVTVLPPHTEGVSSMPLADLPTNVRLQGNVLSNIISFASPTNKENMKTAVNSSIPIRTPNKDTKSGSLTPKLRRGHTFSKSSTDLSTVSNRPKLDKPGYMAATTASKIRVIGPAQLLTETTPSTGPMSRFGSNPLKYNRSLH